MRERGAIIGRHERSHSHRGVVSLVMVRWESGDPGCFVRARVVEDRGPVVAGPDVADLAVAQAVDVDAVPLDLAPARGDAENGALLRAAHDHAHHDLVAL